MGLDLSRLRATAARAVLSDRADLRHAVVGARISRRTRRCAARADARVRLHALSQRPLLHADQRRRVESSDLAPHWRIALWQRSAAAGGVQICAEEKLPSFRQGAIEAPRGSARVSLARDVV